MKKNYLLLVAALWGAATMMAQTVWHTQNYGTMQTDTVYHVTVGPGTTETRAKIQFNTSGSTSTDFNASTYVNYLEIDLTNPYVTMKVARAGKTMKNGVKKSVRDMMAENTGYQNHYFAGVNGDFFGGSPCGYCVADGAFANNGAGMGNGRSTNQLIFDKDGVPYIADEIELNGSTDPGWMVHTSDKLGIVTFPDGQTDQDVRMNAFRWSGYLIAYSDMYFEQSEYAHKDAAIGTTGTNEWGVEASLTPVGNKGMVLGEEVEYVVGQVTQNGVGGNMTIPKGGLVLSGNNCNEADHVFYASKGKMDKLKPGDKVKLNFPFKADGKEMTCREMVGAYPRLVIDGQAISAAPAVTSGPSGAPSDIQLTSRRGRTTVGYNQDKTKLYIFIVEEGKSKANGMTVKALANFMQAVGCYNAINLDGGGSSVLHVENLGQRSAVEGSWTNQREVINGLFAVTNAPEDREVVRIEFVDKALTIKPGRGYQPVIYAYNKYGVLISSGLQNYTLSAPEAKFDASNRKMIAPAEGYFALTATYNGITASIPVKVDAEGQDGSDPATAPSFKGNEFTDIPEKPADWVDPNQPNLFIMGKTNNWNSMNPIIVQPTTGKNFVYEFDIDSTDGTSIDFSYFKMTTIDPRTNGGNAAFANPEGAWHIANDGAAVKRANPDILGNGKTLSIYPGNENNICSPWKGKWHFVVDLENKTITATTVTPAPAITKPEKLYLTGSVEGDRVELTEAKGVYSISNVTLTGETAANFYFTTGAGVNYGAYMNGSEIDGSDDYYEVSNCWSIAPGDYDITFSLNSGKVSAMPHVEPIYAKLEDVTPAGYDFDKYTPGEVWKFAALPATTSTGTWTAPAGIYSQEAMDKDGHVTALHLRGVALDAQTATTVSSGKNSLADKQDAFTIQKHPNELVGNVLVYTQQWSPANTGYNGLSWPCSVNNDQQFQVTFYPDATKIDGSDAKHPIRFRMVLQVLYRGRHDQANTNEISSVYSSGFNAGSAWATSHDGKADNDVAAAYPISHESFYRWVNEGKTIAEMPEVIVLADGDGVAEPWDVGNTNNKYIINGERFMVYEYDFYGKPENGNLAVHVNFNTHPWATFVFKEIKFYNVLNGEEILAQPRAAKAPARVANATAQFTNNTAYGSLFNTRHVSYRYYTEEGVKEFENEAKGESSGVDNIVVGDDANAPVEYYNLQGIKVENPANGIYIKRQGSKATKVLVR